jgi:hypothetical protein
MRLFSDDRGMSELAGSGSGISVLEFDGHVIADIGRETVSDFLDLCDHDISLFQLFIWYIIGLRCGLKSFSTLDTPEVTCVNCQTIFELNPGTNRSIK